MEEETNPDAVTPETEGTPATEEAATPAPEGGGDEGSTEGESSEGSTEESSEEAAA